MISRQTPSLLPTWRVRCGLSPHVREFRRQLLHCNLDAYDPMMHLDNMPSPLLELLCNLRSARIDNRDAAHKTAKRPIHRLLDALTHLLFFCSPAGAVLKMSQMLAPGSGLAKLMSLFLLTRPASRRGSRSSSPPSTHPCQNSL